MSARASLHLTHKTWVNISFENLTLYTQNITFLQPCIKGKNKADVKVTYLDLCLSHRFVTFNADIRHNLTKTSQIDNKNNN